MIARRLVSALWWLTPVVFLVWLWRDGLQCWFLGDDFAWLTLAHNYHESGGLLRALFEPAAQGTIRPWSERGFFLLFESLFGLDSLPFRLMAFATMAADLLLIAWIVRRVTGSRGAGLVSAICWTTNAALMTVMTWNSAFNQALCPLFLLGALVLWIRFLETGLWKYWWWQVVVFSLGFGVLEVNIVYPALAAAWVFFVDPSKKRHTARSLVPLVVISLVYFAIHRAVAPFAASGVYAPEWSAGFARTLHFYMKASFLPVDWEAFGHSPLVGRLVLWLEGAALVAVTVTEFRHRRRATLFFASWFLATLAPVLPLANHLSDYYLTIPLAGLGMLAGYAVSRWPAAAAAPLLAYFAVMAPVALSSSAWSLDKTRPVRAVVLGVVAAHQTHPDKTIVLDGIPGDLYADTIGQGALRSLGLPDVYLTPESRPHIAETPGLANPEITVLDPSAMKRAILHQQVVVYSVSGDHLRNVTEIYERSAPSLLAEPLPRRADIGNPLYSWLLGPTWLSSSSGVRWMPGYAVLRLKGPDRGNKIAIDGYCPVVSLKGAPRHVSITIDGVVVGVTQINDPETDFHRLFAVPDSVAGRESVEIAIHVDPVERRGDQEYGLIFGRIAFLP